MMDTQKIPWIHSSTTIRISHLVHKTVAIAMMMKMTSRRRMRLLRSDSFTSSSLLLLVSLLILLSFHLVTVVHTFSLSSMNCLKTRLSRHLPRPVPNRQVTFTRRSSWSDSSSSESYDAASEEEDSSNESYHADDDFTTTTPSPNRIVSWEESEKDPFRERQLTKRRVPIVGDPQLRVKEKERSVTSILKELAAIQQQGPQKYCILGTRHCSYLHQQIIELLAYALVLSGNHVYTSGAGGTHAATIRGALRAERPDLLTVVLPQSLSKQPKESQELLHKVREIIPMPNNDELSLDVASRICNSYLLSQTDQLIAFAFHESTTVIEATKEAKTLDMLVTVLYLD